MEIHMFLVYMVSGFIVLCFVVYLLLSFHAGALLALAQIDAYEAVSFELALKEVVIEKLLKRKSLHIQNLLKAPLFKVTYLIYKIIYKTKASLKECQKILVEVALLKRMQKSGQIEITSDSFTKEEFQTKLYLLEGLDDYEVHCKNFLEGKTQENILLGKKIVALEEAMEEVKNVDNNVYSDLEATLLSLKEQAKKINVTFIRKKPGGGRTPTRSLKPFFNSGLIFN